MGFDEIWYQQCVLLQFYQMYLTLACITLLQLLIYKNLKQNFPIFLKRDLLYRKPVHNIKLYDF